MAQLPPKVPNILPNWPSLGHHKVPSMGPFGGGTASGNQQPSWVDEFLDFSSARRGSHRRSVSDSVAFLEAPMGGEFDRLDDDQLMYMFSDDVPPSAAASAAVSSSNPSSPSDHNSINEEKIVAGEQQIVNDSEAQSECQAAAAAAQANSNGNGSESIVDLKRVKR